MPDTIEQIKTRLDVVDVISGYVKVQKAGANFKVCCPFHNEKTPSFFISPERQIWHCFGCGKGGDIFGFVKEIEGVEFPEALRILAQRAGVQLQEFDPKARNAKTRLLESVELATKFFEKQLWESPSGQHALTYLRERGLTDETIRTFRLGWAPNDWHALGMFLSSRRFTDRECADAGLIIQRNGKQYDRFRSRITFPIADVNGQVVGFSARIFETEKSLARDVEPAKYINTPQTLIYDKSRILYGLDKARVPARGAGRCVLVEGNMDAIMSFQGGVQNVVATSGTALTPSHLKLLGRYTTNLDFCFDTDQAGMLATRRGIGLALSQNFTVNIVEIGDAECKDPADFVKKYGEKWQTIVIKSKPVIEYYFDKACAGYNPQSAEHKKNIIGTLAPLVRRLASAVEQSHWVSRLAAFLRVGEDAVKEDIRRVRDDLEVYEHGVKEAVSPPVVQLASVDAPVDVLSETLLSLILKRPEMLALPDIQMPLEAIDKKVADVIARIPAGANNATIAELLKEGIQEGSYRLEFAYLKSQELWKDLPDAEMEQAFRRLIALIRRKHVSAQLASLELDIKQAEIQQDAERISELATKFSLLAHSLVERDAS
jgi:DNA primase